MRNKININGINFEFPKFANKDKFSLLNNIFKNLKDSQKNFDITTCSSRKDKKLNREFNEICDIEDDNHVNKIMNYITNDDILIVLDTEFQTFEIENKKRDYVRELGLLIFIKHTTYDKELKPNVNVKWSFIGNIFVNFELLYNESEEFKINNMNCITSEYASVSSENKLKIHKIFHQISTIRNEFDIIDDYNKIIEDFKNNKTINFEKLDDSISEINNNIKKYKTLKFNSCNELGDHENFFKEIIDIYENDSNVRARSFDKEYKEKDFLKDLNKLFNYDITVIIKGDGDIVALKNSNSFYNNSHFGIRHSIDIARQNNYFHSIDVGSAKLEHTYKFLRYGLNTKNKLIKKPFYQYQLGNNNVNYKIISQVAEYLDITFKGKFKKDNLKFHNPIDDCIATFFILMMLNTNLHISVISNMIDDTVNEDIDISSKYFNYNFNIIEKLNETIDFNKIGEFFNGILEDSDSSELLFDFK
jgi:hypothetical protein